MNFDEFLTGDELTLLDDIYKRYVADEKRLTSLDKDEKIAIEGEMTNVIDNIFKKITSTLEIYKKNIYLVEQLADAPLEKRQEYISLLSLATRGALITQSIAYVVESIAAQSTVEMEMVFNLIRGHILRAPDWHQRFVIFNILPQMWTYLSRLPKVIPQSESKQQIFARNFWKIVHDVEGSYLLSMGTSALTALYPRYIDVFDCDAPTRSIPRNVITDAYRDFYLDLINELPTDSKSVEHEYKDFLLLKIVNTEHERRFNDILRQLPLVNNQWGGR